MFTKDKYEIFNSFTTLIFNKEINVNTEIIISTDCINYINISFIDRWY